MVDDAGVNNADLHDDDDAVGGSDTGAGGDEGKPLEGLTARQSQAVLALLNEPTVKKASEVSGVPERTLHRWRAEPVFKKALHTAQREAFSQATAMLVKYSPHAVQTLAKLMTDPACPHATRASAAMSILKMGRESIELEQLVQRIESLEQAAKLQQQSPRLAS